VAATHRDLLDMVKRNAFRMDLYYRLNVFPILLPPLRARREDIPGLATHFVEVYSRRMGKQIDHISPETISTMRSYDWPGNIRELQNFIERSVILTSGNTLEAPLAEISRAGRAAWEAPVPAASAAKTSAHGTVRQSGLIAPLPGDAVGSLEAKKAPLQFAAKPGF
jgi:transcriptional regulator with GAF, ATPase, and Fis domain